MWKHCFFEYSKWSTYPANVTVILIMVFTKQWRANGSSKWTLCSLKQTKRVSELLLAFYFTRLQSCSTALYPAPYPKPYAKITSYSDFSLVLLSTSYTSTKTHKTTSSQEFLASLPPFKGEIYFKPSQERNLGEKFIIKNYLYNLFHLTCHSLVLYMNILSWCIYTLINHIN